jgi:hypothetical protein
MNFIIRSLHVPLSSKSLSVFILGFCFFSAFANADATNGVKELREPRWLSERKYFHLPALQKAGISTDSPSLINALDHTNREVVINAVRLLGFSTNSAAIVKALSHAARSEDEFIALAAFQSLASLGDTTWISEGTNRLSKIQDKNPRIELAALLAFAGRSDGWDFTLDTLSDPVHIRHALLQIEAFDQIKDKAGNNIQVIQALEEQLEKVPLGNRRIITAKLEQLKRVKR